MPIPVEITIPRRWRILRSTYRRVLPASFDEVDEARRLPLWKALCSKPGEAGKLAAIRCLLDLPKPVFNRLSDDQAYELLLAVPWLEALPNPSPRITQFEYKGLVYYLPKTHGLNLMAIEYPIADEAFIKWAETGNQSSALLLCGALCREEEMNAAAVITRGDKRVPLLTKYEAQHRAEHFKDLPEDIRTAVILYFAGVKEFVANSYGKVLFDQPEAGEAKEQTSTTPTLGWWSIYFSLAIDGPFGRDVKLVYQTPFHEVCLHLVDRVRQQKAEAMQRKLSSKGFGHDE
jgi:hypothetical protein